MNNAYAHSVRQLLFFLFVAAFGTSAWAAATAQTVKGAAQVTPAKGSAGPLDVGQRIQPGDTIKTGLNSSVTLRFDDGQMIALSGETTYSLDEYKFNPQKPQEGSFLSSLVKGGLRAVTGLIGEKNPQDVKFRTPVATAGIRGTDFDLFFDGRLYISVRTGAIAVTNEGGVALFAANQQPVGMVQDSRTLAKPADPTTFPAPAKSSIRQTSANQDLGAKPADPKDPTCSDRR